MKISIENRQKVLNLHGISHNQCEISKRFSVSRYVVQNIIKKHREGLPLHERLRSGRLKKLNIRDERLIARETRKNPFFTSWLLKYGQHFFNQIDITKVQAIRLYISKKLRLFPHHKRNRLKFCRQQTDWTGVQWCRYIFSDEV